MVRFLEMSFCCLASPKSARPVSIGKSRPIGQGPRVADKRARWRRVALLPSRGLKALQCACRQSTLRAMTTARASAAAPQSAARRAGRVASALLPEGDAVGDRPDRRLGCLVHARVLDELALHPRRLLRELVAQGAQRRDGLVDLLHRVAGGALQQPADIAGCQLRPLFRRAPGSSDVATDEIADFAFDLRENFRRAIELDALRRCQRTHVRSPRLMPPFKRPWGACLFAQLPNPNVTNSRPSSRRRNYLLASRPQACRILAPDGGSL